jgi:hypothetical protein
MPIVFQDVTGEIAPERGAAQAEAPEPSSPSGGDSTETIRRELDLMRERDLRLRVD